MIQPFDPAKDLTPVTDGFDPAKDLVPVSDDQLPAWAKPKSLLGKAMDVSSGLIGAALPVPGPGTGKDLVMGVEQSALDTIKGASDIGGSLLKGIGKAVLPKDLEQKLGVDQWGESSNAKLARPEDIVPQNTTQKVGKFAGDIAQFFIPGAKVAEVTKAIETSTAIAKLPAKFQTIAKLLGIGATEGIAAGGVSLAQEGELNSNVKWNAGISAAIPFAGPVKNVLAQTQAWQNTLTPVGKWLTQKLPGGLMDSWLKVKAADVKFGKDPGKWLVDNGITANTKIGLYQKIAGTAGPDGKMVGGYLQTIGKQIEEKLTGVGPNAPKIDVAPIVKMLDEEIQAAISTGEQALFDRLQTFRTSITHNFSNVDGKLLPSTEKILTYAPIDAHSLKVDWGKSTKWTGQAFDTEVNQVKVRAYGMLNDMLDKAAPGVKALQMDYANALTTAKILEKNVAQAAYQMWPTLQEMGGVVLTGQTKAGLLGAGAALTTFMALKTTAVRTRIAQMLKNSGSLGGKNLAPSVKALLLALNKLNNPSLNK